MHLSKIFLALAVIAPVQAQTLPPLAPAGAMIRQTTALSRAISLLGDPAPIGRIKRQVSMPRLRPALSQNPYPACVGFSLTHLLNASQQGPWYNLPRSFAIDLWRFARDHDIFKENDGDENAGTLVYPGELRLRALKYFSKVEQYDIWTEREARKKILTFGAGVLSTDWREGDNWPDQNGGIHFTGPVVGGHAILVYDFRYAETVTISGRKVRLPDRYYVQQSWSGFAPYDVWGQCVWMSAADMRRRLNQGGYIVFPTKSKARVK